MKKGIIIIIAFLTICSVFKVQGQDNKADSLLQLYEKAKQDTTRIQLLRDIGDLYRNNKPDTALYYYHEALNLIEQTIAKIPSDQMASDSSLKFLYSVKAQTLLNTSVLQRIQGDYDKSMENLLKAINIFEKLGDKKGIAMCYNGIGIIQYYLGNYDNAIENYLKSIKIDEELGAKERISKCYTNIGLIYQTQGAYDKALEYFLKSLVINEELVNKKGMATCYFNIGNNHYIQDNFNKALENFLKSLKVFEELDNKMGLSACYNSIGLFHYNKGNYEEAINNYLKSLKIDEELGDKRGMLISYDNIGSAHLGLSNYSKALENYLRSLKIAEELNDKHGISTIYGNISTLHIIVADTLEIPNTRRWSAHLDSALYYSKIAYDLAIEIGSLSLQNQTSEFLKKAYTKLSNYKEALKYAEIYIATKDSMFSEEKTKALTEMTTKYEAEKKQLQIEKMEKQKELDDKTIEAQQAQNRKQQIMIFSTVVGFLIVLVFSMIILRMFRQKRKANVLLAAQNDEINQQKAKIEVQNQNITDSIVYAQRIQRALLPPGDYMKQLLPKRFILYKPRDIVSGDFYWVSKKDDVVITAVADCTGHGVPGAMMSMLGVSILNEVVSTMKKLDAGAILNNLRTKIIDSLHQGGQDTQMYDGMDLALCLIDLKKMKVQFGGANCPLCLIREGKLKEVVGDKMPIGPYARMEEFSNHNLKIQEGDMLYLFSDGYADQFGGENDKRFSQRRFRKLLVDIHNKSMPEQKEELEKNLKEWQGKSDQIDDILVMGVRV